MKLRNWLLSPSARLTCAVPFTYHRLRFAALLVALYSVIVCNAFAGSITIFNTGENNGVALALGQLDPHYTLVSAPQGVPLTAMATLPSPSWTPNTATADWISPGNSHTIFWPVGTYDYRTIFSLAGFNPTTAQLAGLWASDNNGCIFLNGANTNICTPYQGFGALAAFSITSGFVPGINTLDLMVFNGGLSTGTIVEIHGTANPTTPEPSSLLLLVSGLLGGLGVIRRRRHL